MPTTRAAAAFMGTKKPAIDDDAATEDYKADPALFLSPELLCLVIKQLREIEERMPPLSYRKNVTNLPRIALLSRGWADGISEFVNDGASEGTKEGKSVGMGVGWNDGALETLFVFSNRCTKPAAFATKH